MRSAAVRPHEPADVASMAADVAHVSACVGLDGPVELRFEAASGEAMRASPKARAAGRGDVRAPAAAANGVVVADAGHALVFASKLRRAPAPSSSRLVLELLFYVDVDAAADGTAAVLRASERPWSWDG